MTASHPNLNPSALSLDAFLSLQRSGTEFELLDVRRAVARRKQGGDIAGGHWLAPEEVMTWKDAIAPGPLRVVYCAHGHEISQGVASILNAMGHRAVNLEGGYSAWLAAKQPVQPLPQTSRWVTRERPKIDRIACPWLIARFVDPQAEFLYVPADQVLAVAEREHATPYDFPGVELSHVGDLCSFDAVIQNYQLNDAPLQRLATIVRGADTDHHELAPQCAGLLAMSLGLSTLHSDDHACLAQGMAMYDALYAWCSKAQGEQHAWTLPSPAA